MPILRSVTLYSATLCLALLGNIIVSAQTPAQNPITPLELSRRVEVTVRNHFNIPPEMQLTIGAPTPSDIAGFNNIIVVVTNNGKSVGNVTLMLSTDLKTLLGVVRFDLTKDPGNSISVVGRPVRGNPAASVKVIVFDDLQCPYCAMMHAKLFPEAFDHYKDKVAFIYKDFPLIEIHPWAMHAAVDVNCIVAQNTPQSGAAYWKLVDDIHAHAREIGATKASAPPPATTTPAAAGTKSETKPATSPITNPIVNPIFDRLDTMTLDQATASGLDLTAVKSCIQKQDPTGVNASVKEAAALSLNATPTLYIDGEKMDGVIDTNVLWDSIDNALIAHGVQPPSRTPPAKSPAQPPAQQPTQAPTSATPVSPPAQ